MDETELEEERIKPIFGEALACYAIAKSDLVVFHLLMNCKKTFGSCYEQWSSDLYVLDTSAIVGLIGIYTHKDNVHVLQKHPELSLLTLDECGISSEGDLKDAE